MGDPRVYFAAERTLLAWVRTGLTVMAFGFVVARFGLFLTLLPAAAHGARLSLHGHLASSVMGIVLVLIGVAVALGGLYNHRRYVRALPPEDVPAVALPWLGNFLSSSLAAVGIAVALYLAVS